jgi:hypothetical protein
MTDEQWLRTRSLNDRIERRDSPAPRRLDRRLIAASRWPLPACRRKTPSECLSTLSVMSLDDDLRRSLPSEKVRRELCEFVRAQPSQKVMREMGESVQALRKSVGLGALEEVKKVGQVMSDAQLRAMRAAMPRIDVSQISDSMAGEFEREQSRLEISTEWMAAEAERRWAVVETRDAIYALQDEMDAARADAQVARVEARSARRLNLVLTIAVLVLGVPSAVVAVLALIALL